MEPAERDSVPTQQHPTEHPPNQNDGLNNIQTEDGVTLTIHHHGKPIPITLAASSTLADLSDFVAAELGVATANQKFMITPRTGTLKPPFENDIPIAQLASKKIVLLGSSILEIGDLSARIEKLSAPRKPSPIKAAAPARTHNWRKAQDALQYTFHTIRPLAYLPRSERSQRFLERLRDDPGIRAAMAAHRFSVGLLTEMDPAAHTTHESRTLGLNRNAGEVIELRLRTDAYDGYRDYRTIRTTLCHELAHNVFGEHDRRFYDLMAQIEKEVQRADWTRGGRSVGQDEFYNPDDGGVGEHVDSGGWSGGEYVLGTGGSSSAGPSATAGLSRREVLARAAEARLGKTQGGSEAQNSEEKPSPNGS